MSQIRKGLLDGIGNMKLGKVTDIEKFILDCHLLPSSDLTRIYGVKINGLLRRKILLAIKDFVFDIFRRKVDC